MKIAIFSDCYLDLTGGIKTSIDAQKCELEKRGHTVYLFSTGFPRSTKKKLKLMRDHIYLVPSCKLFFYKLAPISRRPKVIERWLLKNFPELKDFDVFYVHYEAGCSIAGLRLAKQLKIPSVQVMHGREDMGETNIIPRSLRTFIAVMLNWFHSWYLPHHTKIKKDDYLANSIAKAKMWEIMVNHANSADLVISPSRHFCDKLAHYGVKKDIKVLPNGLFDELFIEEVEPRSLEKGHELRIIWHSRVSAEKRMMPFLKALSKVHGNYRLDVFGGGGDYFRAKRFAKRHKLKAFFYNNQPFEKIYSCLARAHLDVLVSYNFDTFGMTLIEAESLGVPVFFCDPDMKEVVPKNSYILSEDETIEKMAEALQDLIDHPEKIQPMSEVMLEHRSEVLVSRRIDTLEKYFNDIIKA